MQFEIYANLFLKHDAHRFLDQNEAIFHQAGGNMIHGLFKLSGITLFSATLFLCGCSTSNPEVANNALLFSAERSTVAEVNHNLAEGADINARDKDGFTPLHMAAGAGHADVVQLLISKGAEVNAANKIGVTPLHVAAATGHVDIADLLISKGANVNSRRNDGLTPLHFAAREGYKNIVELLISKGADINAKSKDGKTPLAYAMERKQDAVVKLLKGHGGTL
jgi:ankyrin repeat protein